MRIVVTGGTGLIGRKLSTKLLDRGDEVTIFTRDIERARRHHALDARARLAKWEPKDSASYAHELEGVHAVIHLAGEGVADAAWTEERKAILRASRIESTAVLASAIATATEKPKVFVSASAVGIYGKRHDASISTEDDRKGGDFLADLSLDWEAAAAPAREAFVRTLHPRFGIVLAADGGALEKMLTPFKFFVGGPIGDGQQYFSWIHWADAVDGLLFAMDEHDFEGPFNLTAPTPVQNREFARTLGEVLGRPSFAAVPPFALKLALGRELAASLLDGQRVVPKRLLDAGFSFRFPTLGPALRDLLGR